jgi:hypothetical protein
MIVFFLCVHEQIQLKSHFWNSFICSNHILIGSNKNENLNPIKRCSQNILCRKKIFKKHWSPVKKENSRKNKKKWYMSYIQWNGFHFSKKSKKVIWSEKQSKKKNDKDHLKVSNSIQKKYSHCSHGHNLMRNAFSKLKVVQLSRTLKNEKSWISHKQECGTLNWKKIYDFG